jgi:hypothetical protein
MTETTLAFADVAEAIKAVAGGRVPPAPFT